MNYELSDKGMADIIGWEAIILTPYLCSANEKTIGIGATKSDIPDLAKWPWDKSITVEEAVAMFRKHVKKYADAVNKKLTREVTQEQFDALVSITYNIGVGGMQGSTFMARVNAGDSPARVAEAMRRWNKAGGKVSKGLVNRRMAETTLYVDGRYNFNGKAYVTPVGSNHRPIYSKGKQINLADYL